MGPVGNSHAPLSTNCSSWVGMEKNTYKTLNDLQYTYLRMIYSCPPSTPLLALRTHAGIMDCERRIWVEKVCMVASRLRQSRLSTLVKLEPPGL